MKAELHMNVTLFLLRHGADKNKTDKITNRLTKILSRSKEIGHNIYSNLCAKDRDDNKFIDCAIESRCGIIITEDTDLSGLEGIIEHKYHCPIKILSPYQFITEYL